ncbi:DUF4390 domain-containing protein [Woeseiaceae bacterium]|nr:DUF4390 domain-containing protein [Woeseiaceae bacterium]
MTIRLASSLAAIIKSSLITILFLMPATAQEGPDHIGYFDVQSVSSSLVAGVHELDSRIQIVLSDEALEALNSGVVLRIEFNIEIIRVRRFILDSLDAELLISHELEYRPLSQRYIVNNINSSDQDSFATLYSALNHLGRIQRLPIIDDSIFESDKTYRARLRARLSTKQYPALLQALFFWRDQWQLESDWIEWILER